MPGYGKFRGKFDMNKNACNCSMLTIIRPFAFAAAPKFSLDKNFKDTLVIKAGNSDKSEMGFLAHPEPTVTLTFSGRKITDTDRIKVTRDKTKLIFSVNDSERFDAGQYTVKLENEYGSVTQEIKVIILGMEN